MLYLPFFQWKGIDKKIASYISNIYLKLNNKANAMKLVSFFQITNFWDSCKVPGLIWSPNLWKFTSNISKHYYEKICVTKWCKL